MDKKVKFQKVIYIISSLLFLPRLKWTKIKRLKYKPLNNTNKIAENY